MNVSRSIIISLLAFGTITSSLATPVAAAEDQCRQQLHQFCASVPHEQGQRRACMDQHLSQLSPECQERVKAWREHHQGEGRHHHPQGTDTPSTDDETENKY